MPKRAKTKRDLSAIEAELFALDKREIVEVIIKRGQLLLEVRDLLDHGEWLPWLKRECDYAESSARNYIEAAEFAAALAKSLTVGDFKLTPTALYLLANEFGLYDLFDDETSAILDPVLKVARNERITRNRAKEIMDKAWGKIGAAEEAKEQAAQAKRLKWEAANPEKAKTKARDHAIAYAMEDERDEAKQEAKESGGLWGDIREEWEAEWIENNWRDEQEAEFEAEWKTTWARDHGSVVKAPEPKTESEASAEAMKALHAKADADADRWTEQTAEEAKAEEGAAEARREIEIQEDSWHRALRHQAGEAILGAAYLDREHGDWTKFQVTEELIALAEQAAMDWQEVAKQLATRFGGRNSPRNHRLHWCRLDRARRYQSRHATAS